MGDAQQVFLPPKCVSIGTVMHELMHALGFHHEHNRPDRDDYITVHSLEDGGMTRGTEINFEILSVEYVDTLGTKYDYCSIMHYYPLVPLFGGKVRLEAKKNGS